jgi:hypothetical protein
MSCVGRRRSVALDLQTRSFFTHTLLHGPFDICGSGVCNDSRARAAGINVFPHRGGCQSDLRQRHLRRSSTFPQEMWMNYPHDAH